MKLIYRDILGNVLWQTWAKVDANILPREDERVVLCEKNWRVLYITHDLDNSRIYIELRSDA